MTILDINVTETLKKIKESLDKEKGISSELRALITILINLVEALVDRLGVNSSNSGQPPSQDPNRNRGGKGGSGRKPGGQFGRDGKTLDLVDDPDEVILLQIARDDLPEGKYESLPPERRQKFDIIIKKHITEYQAEILRNLETGEIFKASFPDEIKVRTQYGPHIASFATYMSFWQMIPYDRLAGIFADYADLPISVGTLVNFNFKAYETLQVFEDRAIQKFIGLSLIHVDETGLQITKTKYWLHTLSSDYLSLFSIHEKRGKKATDEIGVLPHFKGTLVHDCWTAYFMYDQCIHAICNAHIIRELERLKPDSSLTWPALMQEFLWKLKDHLESKNSLPINFKKEAYDVYSYILELADQETPLPPPKPAGKKGKVKKSKARNLLERMKKHTGPVLRFLENPEVPFTNNMAENDIRMTKVKQKISGCFRSITGAKCFARGRSFLLTCQKNGISITEAMHAVNDGRLEEILFKIGLGS